MNLLATVREALARVAGFGRGLASRNAADDAMLREEMEAHFEMHVAENIRRGMTPEAARRDARQALGNVTAGVESVRGQRGLPALDALATDLRVTARVLRAQKGFSLGVILILALGIGATVAMFTVLNATLLRPLPYPDPERIVSLSVSHDGVDGGATDDRTMEAWIAGSRGIEAFSAYAGRSAVVQTAGGPREVRGAMVTASYFRVMGVLPVLGRVFTGAEDRPGAASVVVLGEGLWQSAFGGDSGLVGRTVVVDGEAATVVGIMPASFAGRAQFWKPYRLRPAEEGTTFYYQVLARARPGVSLETLRAELGSIQQRLAASRPASERRLEPVVMTMHERRFGSVRVTLSLLFAAVGVLLLITCANIANLTLARAVRRRREFALRLALGASRWRIVRHVLVECAILAAVGGALGLALAMACVRYFQRISPSVVAEAQGVGIDGSVLAFTLATTALVTVLFGLVPAVAAARGNENVALAGASARTAGSRGQRLLRRGLVVFELATALVLVVGATLVARSFWTVASTPHGFTPAGASAATISLPYRSYDDGRARAFMEELLARAGAIPGVRSAAIADALPLQGARMSTGPKRGEEGPRYDVVGVTSGYFATVGTRVVEGRAIVPADRAEGAPVAVVSRALARRIAPAGSAIGGRITVDGRETTIVGVTEDVRQRGLEGDPSLVAFVPLAQLGGWHYVQLAVRGVAGDRALADAIGRIVSELDPMLPAPEVRPMEEIVAEQVAPRRFVFVLLASFAGLAGTLAVLGLYSVMSYLVSEQTREIGIRIALGADARRVSGFVLGQGMALTVLGVGVGLLAAWAGARTMESLVYGVGVRDAGTFAATAALLTTVALVASLLPARRASRTDPVGALRADG